MGTSERPSLAYPYKDGLYLNITSRCPTACVFCIKFSWKYRYRGYDLKLPAEPSVADILRDAAAFTDYREAVFCGYGESTYRLKEMEQVSDHFRKAGVPRVRLNTIGLGSLIHGRDIVPDLARFLDAVHISFNTADPRQYLEWHRPLPEYRDRAFDAVQEFIRRCARAIPETVVTAVDRPDADLRAVEQRAASLGAAFRRRPYLGEREDA
jgi:TatD family-associated radical SAM protein